MRHCRDYRPRVAIIIDNVMGHCRDCRWKLAVIIYVMFSVDQYDETSSQSTRSSAVLFSSPVQPTQPVRVNAVVYLIVFFVGVGVLLLFTFRFHFLLECSPYSVGYVFSCG